MRAERMKVAVMHRALPLSSAFDENTDSTAPTDTCSDVCVGGGNYAC